MRIDEIAPRDVTAGRRYPEQGMARVNGQSGPPSRSWRSSVFLWSSGCMTAGATGSASPPLAGS